MVSWSVFQPKAGSFKISSLVSSSLKCVDAFTSLMSVSSVIAMTSGSVHALCGNTVHETNAGYIAYSD